MRLGGNPARASEPVLAHAGLIQELPAQDFFGMWIAKLRHLLLLRSVLIDSRQSRRRWRLHWSSGKDAPQKKISPRRIGIRGYLIRRSRTTQACASPR